MNQEYKRLEFDQIQSKLSEYALTNAAKKKIAELGPYLKEQEVKNRLKETTEARKILDTMGQPPICAMQDLEDILNAAEKGEMLLPSQLEQVNQFLAACERLTRFLHRSKFLEVAIAYYEDSIVTLNEVREQIEQSIRNEQVDDYASDLLRNTRRQIENVNTQIRLKLEQMLKNQKECFSDQFVSIRNGHFVLPVKKEYKYKIQGTVIDTSATGSTIFIEPNAVAKYFDELNRLDIEEENEVRRILYTLTALVYDHIESMRSNQEIIEHLDFVFAKGKLSAELNAIEPSVNVERKIVLKEARHPLLNQESCVPLDFSIGDGYEGIIITGPNTGGKTVSLKTVGLLSLMAQSGLHIPCKEANVAMNSEVLCDIGDGQSITENLSTFSSHIKNIIEIISSVSSESLVLLDELGSGTDPQEGMGIAIAILEELRKVGCLFVATTHYPEVKVYGERTDGIKNARMAFDQESLKPLYQLVIGESGESCALYIAKKLGLPNRMLQCAFETIYETDLSSKKGKQVKRPAWMKEEETKQVEKKRDQIQKIQPKKEKSQRAKKFQLGDSVVVYPEKKIGIIFETADEKGYLGVQMRKSRMKINHKRLKLKAAAAELYPEDYDFSVIFDTVENRKRRHRENRKGIDD